VAPAERKECAIAADGVMGRSGGDPQKVPCSNDKSLPRPQRETIRRKKLITRCTGNVFRDLGFSKEESEHLLVRADLLIQVHKAITSRRLNRLKRRKCFGSHSPE
jgi:hypothetical protein